MKFVRGAALGAAMVMASASSARAESAGVGEPGDAPSAKRIAIYAQLAGAAVLTGLAVYWQIDAASQASKQNDFVSARGGSIAATCATPSPECAQYLGFRHDRNLDVVHSELALTGALMLATTSFLTYVIWPNTRVAPTLGGLTLRGTF